MPAPTMKLYTIGCECKDYGCGPRYYHAHVVAETDEEALRQGYLGSGVESVDIVKVEPLTDL